MKRIIKALLIVMVLTMAVMAFVGCEQEVDPCADGHTFEAFGEEPATCTTAGKSAGVVCKVCGYEERTRFEIPAKGHNMADATCTEPSTCTREGCGYTEGEALGHSLVDVAEVPATCTEVGYTAHKGCERCSYTEGKEEIALIAHSYTKDVEAKAPTCLPGYEAHKVCDVCGKADPETFVEIPSLGDEGHLFEEENYFVYQEPTCSEQGLLAGVCSYCEKAFLLSYIPALPHEMVDGKCSVCGHEHAFEYGVCDCGEKDPTYVDYYLIGYINGADYGCNNDYENLGEYKFVDGKLTVTFTQDSYVFVKTGDLFGANKDWFMSSTYENDKDAILANTSTGTSEKLFIPGNVEVVLTLTINDDGTLTLVADYHVHVFSDATCTEAAKCECGETQGEALGHTWVDATCTAPKTCSVCNATEGEALGHTWVDATCTAPKTCSVCNATEGEALGHTWVDATCTAPKTCSVCNATEGEALGHDFFAGSCKVCQAIDPDYNAYILNFSQWPEFAKETYADGDVLNYNDIFTFIMSKNSRVDTSSKTWDDFTGTLRFSFGGKTPTGSVPSKNALKITADGAYIVKIWYVAGGDGRYFALLDENGTVMAETTKDTIKNSQYYAELVIPAAGTYYFGVPGDNNYIFQIELVKHTHVYTDVVTAPTCTEAGYTTHTCTCGYSFNDTEVAALGHDMVVDAAVDATCTSTGLTEGSHCSRCDHKVAQEEVPALGHTEEVVPGKAPTCTETGLTDGKKCSVCGETLLAQEEIAAIGHAYSTVYSWADDNSACTKTDVCANDEGHNVSETVVVSTVKLDVTATKVTYTFSAQFADGAQTKVVEGDVTLENSIATINAPAIAGRVASHDYVKFGFHDATATYTFTIYYSEVDVWDGTSVSTSLAGTGTEEDPFLIQSAADFAYFAGQLNAAAVGQTQNFEGKYFKMTKSVDLNNNLLIAGNHSGWNKYQGFGGTFDGNNCTIRGINVEPTTGTSSGLFGCITKSGTLKNLIVYGNAKGAATVGAVVAYQLGTVDNVTSYVTVTATAGTVGGIVANQENSAGNLTNCVNYGTVTSDSYIVGGIVGSGGNSISNCVNWGTISGTDVIGGVIGGTKNKGTIFGCINYGTINGQDKIGGIVGGLLKSLTNSVNYGVVNGSSLTGGIAGWVESGTVTISGSSNNGAVNGGWTIGGILGHINTGATVTISNCTNNADIIGNTTGIGGILGTAHESAAGVTISGCTNNGNVSSTSWGIGGIAGNTGSTVAVISECINNGRVSAAGQLGGIVGRGYGKVTGCTNNGAVVGTVDLIGGIVGQLHDTTYLDIAKTTNENTGTVEGPNSNALIGKEG